LIPDKFRDEQQRRPLRALFFANAISLLGNSFALIALPWFVLQTTGSPAMTGIAGAAAVLPNFTMGLFGGVLIDRFGPIRISIMGDLVSAAAVAAVPALYAIDHLPFGLLLALIFIGALFDVPGVAARRTVLPQLARGAQTPQARANAVFEAMPALAFLLGPPIAGILVSQFGAPVALWINAASFLVSSGLLWLLIMKQIAVRPSSIGDQPRGTPGKRYLADVTEGLRFIWTEPAVRLIATGFFIFGLVGRPFFAVVLPAWAADQGRSASLVGALTAVFGAGAIAGTVAYGWFGDHLRRSLLWRYYFLVLPIGFLLLALDAPILVIAAGLAVSAWFDGATVPMSVTVRQQRTPPEILGRVFATTAAITQSTAPIGMIGFGILLERAGTSNGLFMITGICLVAVLFVLLFAGSPKVLD
jgi:MFS family permease